MDQQIKITAEVDRGDIRVCRFTVDRTVYGSSARFTSSEEAKGSPLPETIFGLGGIERILVSQNVVTVTKSGFEQWPELGKKIGAAIRQALNSGVPAISPSLKQDFMPAGEMHKRVQSLLDSQINPSVAGHGGYVELIDVKDNNVFLRLGGGCQGCGAADITLKQGIEKLIRNEVPDVFQVLDVTDHAAGQNPYYAPSK